MIKTRLLHLGVLSLAAVTVMAYGREFGPASPATGDPLSAGSDSRVSTGSKAFDLLLDAKLPPGEVASGPRSGAGRPESDAAVPGGPPKVAGEPPASLRDALLQDAASTLATGSRASGKVEPRIQAELDEASKRPGWGRETSVFKISPLAMEPEPLIPPELLAAVREYRYAILGTASICLALVVMRGARRSAAREFKPHKPGRRRREARARRSRRDQ